MSNPRKKIIYDSTLANAWEIDANNSGPVVLYDSNGDELLTASNPGTIQATGLDIRSLKSASDSVEVIQDTAGDLNATVVATDLDIRDLDASQDNVEVVGVKPDGTNTMPSLDAAARAGYVTLTNGTISPEIVAHEGQTSIRTISGHQEEFVIHLNAENVTATAGFMLIDLSDTTNWPHTNTDHIIVNTICFSVNPSTAFSGEIDFGFLTAVDGDNGDFNQILTIHNTQTSAVSLANQHNFPNGLDLELAEWFGPTTANDTTFQTDVNLQGPDGATSYPSGAGDMVLKITRTAGNVDVGVTVTYITA